jgi:hypothetical protein
MPPTNFKRFHTIGWYNTETKIDHFGQNLDQLATYDIAMKSSCGGTSYVNIMSDGWTNLS